MPRATYTTAYLYHSGHAVASPGTDGITLSVWFKTTNTSGGDGRLINLGSGDATPYDTIYLGTNTAAQVGAFAYNGGSGTSALTSNTVTLNTWAHAAGTFKTASRYAWLNGTKSAESTTPVTTANLDGRIQIGAVYWNGTVYANSVPTVDLAHAAVWTTGLSDADIGSLYAGADPRLIRPEKLYAYFPLISGSSGLLDWVGDSDLTENASCSETASTPSVFMSSGIWVPYQVAEAAGIIVSDEICSAVGSIVSPSVSFGSISVTIGTVSAVGSIISPSVSYGSISVSGGTLSAVGSIVGPTVTLGGVSVENEICSAVGSITGETVSYGSISVDGGTLSAVGSIVSPTVVIGGIVVENETCSAVGSVISPTVSFGSIAISNETLTGVGTITGPSVAYGSISVTIGTVSAVGSIVDPSVAVGGVVVSNEICSGVGSIIGPTVTLGGVVVSNQTCSAVGSVVSPDVAFGSIVISNETLSGDGAILSPSVSFGSIAIQNLILEAFGSVSCNVSVSTEFDLATCRTHYVTREYRIHRIDPQTRVFVLSCSDVK